MLKEGVAEFLNHLFDDIPSKIIASDLENLELIIDPPELELLNKDTSSNFHRFYFQLSLGNIKELAYKLQ